LGDEYDDGAQRKVSAFAFWSALMDSFKGDSVRVLRGGVFAKAEAPNELGAPLSYSDQRGLAMAKSERSAEGSELGC
jgi:hypothetical protein